MVLGLIHKIIIIQGSWMKQNLKKPPADWGGVQNSY